MQGLTLFKHQKWRFNLENWGSTGKSDGFTMKSRYFTEKWKLENQGMLKHFR